MNEPVEFELIVTLSYMFSRYYAEQTIGDKGVTQTDWDMAPYASSGYGWLAIKT